MIYQQKYTPKLISNTIKATLIGAGIVSFGIILLQDKNNSKKARILATKFKTKLKVLADEIYQNHVPPNLLLKPNKRKNSEIIDRPVNSTRQPKRSTSN